MSRSKILWTTMAAVMAVALLAGPPLRAAERTPWVLTQDTEDPQQALEGAMRQLLFALDLMIAAIPQYEAPEVLPNGDIIIRRIPPSRPEAPTPDNTQPSDQDDAHI